MGQEQTSKFALLRQQVTKKTSQHKPESAAQKNVHRKFQGSAPTHASSDNLAIGERGLGMLPKPLYVHARHLAIEENPMMSPVVCYRTLNATQALSAPMEVDAACRHNAPKREIKLQEQS